MLYRFCVLRELEKAAFLGLLFKPGRFLLMKTFIVMLLIVICGLMVAVVLDRLEV
jgi:hypothetical protein